MNPVHELRKLAAYLLAKRTEVQDLDFKDIVLAKVILDIHRKRLRKDLVMVPLFHLKPIHRLDRETAIQATERRVEMLRSERDALLAAREITCKMLAEVLPSVSWIKVVQEGPESYLAFEGNGRLAALQRVFNAADGMAVEVELYRFRRPRTIIRRLNRVRRHNRLVLED